MKRIAFLLPLILTGCAATMMGSSKNNQHQTEMALHKARTDVEELRCDLNSTQAQLLILENKLGNQDLAFSSLKQDVIGVQQAKIDELNTALALLEKQCKQINKQQSEALSLLEGLSTNDSDTKAALSQYKEKITEVEHKIAVQNKKIEEIVKLKQTVEELASLAFQFSQEQKGGKS
ncbi:MAG: hypothetical protein KDK44_06485 [Chlamydiia bacterium]|nr:hypothetical protein [Chlamydiia bacterium]MCP5509496.1 hypothetical protein [Chlamydiales bacterium]HPE84638.1 hypothetical protein [Chlamydiales bacterium]